MQITIHITGTSPLLMHNPRMVDPECPFNREMAPLTAKRKKTDEDLQKIAALEWHGGLYTDDGDPPRVVQPTSKLRKCLIEAGAPTKQGKALGRAITFLDVYVPLQYDGPEDIHALHDDPRFHSRLSVGVGQKRVMRTRPQFFPWALTQRGLFIPDAGVNVDEMDRLLRLAGAGIGIGDNRANGYGRFTATYEVTA